MDFFIKTQLRITQNRSKLACFGPHQTTAVSELEIHAFKTYLCAQMFIRINNPYEHHAKIVGKFIDTYSIIGTEEIFDSSLLTRALELKNNLGFPW